MGSWTIRVVASVFLVIVLAVALAAPAAADVAVVVNPSVPTDDITFAELRELLFADRVFWSSKLRVTILIPAGKERMVILKTVYQMTEVQFRQFWIAKLFRAEASAGPKIVYTDEMAIELARAIPGAMALIDSAHVTGGAKVLRIDGRLPGERGYPLR